MLNALSQIERSLLLQSVGTHRKGRKLSPIDVARMLKKALSSQTIESVAKDLELADTSVLRRFHSLLKLPTELQSLVVWGKQTGYLGFSVAAEITRLEKEDQIQRIATAALENSLSKEETRAILQRMARSKIDTEVAIQEILNLRPILEKQHLFMGLMPRCWQNAARPDEEARSRLRQRLASLIDASEILSVACSKERYSFLLKSSAVESPKIFQMLSREKIDNFVESLLCDDEDKP